MRTKEDLIMMQSLPLELKVAKTKLRIQEWVNHYGRDGVYVSFSGGKDSTVLLHIVREMYPDIEAVFVNTGLEYPEIQKFVKTFDNVTILRPKMRFDEVIKNYGYPIISKDISGVIYGVRAKRKKGQDVTQMARYKKIAGTLMWQGEKNSYCCDKYFPLLDVNFNISDKCCHIMKKDAVHKFERQFKKKPIIATMTEESRLRESSWIKSGCNAFDGSRPRSAPMSFWTEQDVLRYIVENRIEIASVYGDITTDGADGQLHMDGCGGKLRTTKLNRTGCVFCAYGCHLESEPTRFQMLKESHPKQYEYCIGGGEFNEDGEWQPSKEGLGMGYVFDRLNEMYGEDFIKYK